MAVAPKVREAPPLAIPRQIAPRPERRLRIPRTWAVRFGLIVAALLFLLPFYWMANSALKDLQELSAFPPTLYPHTPAWANFQRAVTYIPFGTFLLNSIILTTGVTLGAAISNPLIAYGFSRIQWPGRDFVFGIVLATIFLPFPVLIVALFDIFAKLGWIDTFLPIIVPAFFGNPFFIFLMRQFLLGLPSEISEQARIDGANEFQVFFHIILPLAKPAIAVVVIFAAVQAWGEFLTPLLFLQDESKYPLSIGLQFYRQEHDVAYNLLMAASSLIVLPIVALFLAFQRFFIQGVTVGAVKG
ncbi:MAG TPA: carbohydrate ABC transporter permease [Candidatus Dormibacteraeota bacterium]|jgi:multiple sugar transport system permease protein|nr:carbohydrate ABC transporter permease [Candidatus Dormibacteraeota bacterium]